MRFFSSALIPPAIPLPSKSSFPDSVTHCEKDFLRGQSVGNIPSIRNSLDLKEVKFVFYFYEISSDCWIKIATFHSHANP